MEGGKESSPTSTVSPLPQATWAPPRIATHKLNIDGPFNRTIGIVGIEGILRNDKGNLVQASTDRTVANSTLEAEMQAFLRWT